MTFTWPYFGTASSISDTFAVRTYSGGESSSACGSTRPARRSRFSFARLVLISFARLSASILWVSERSGAVEGDLVAAGMGGDYTQARSAVQGRRRETFLQRRLAPQTSSWSRLEAALMFHALAFRSCFLQAAETCRKRRSRFTLQMPRFASNARSSLADSSARGGVAEVLGADRDAARARRHEVERVLPALDATHADHRNVARATQPRTSSRAPPPAPPGPDRPPCPAPSHGLPVSGSIASARRVLISEIASAPPRSAASRDRARRRTRSASASRSAACA